MKFQKNQRVKVKSSSPLRKLSKSIVGKTGSIKKVIGFSGNGYAVALDDFGVTILYAQELEPANSVPVMRCKPCGGTGRKHGEPCDTCGGIGIVHTDGSIVKESNREPKIKTVECYSCGGTGTEYDETCVQCGGKGYTDEDGRYVDDEDEDVEMNESKGRTLRYVLISKNPLKRETKVFDLKNAPTNQEELKKILVKKIPSGWKIRSVEVLD